MTSICQVLTPSPITASEMVLIFLTPLMRRLQFEKNK